MWIEFSSGVSSAIVGMVARRRTGAIVGILAAAMLVACGGDGSPGTDQPAAQAGGGNGAVAPQANADARPATVADIFPAGEGRELLLNTCASCHAVACAAMGQRTDARWRDLEEAHASHVAGLPDEDRQRIFTYLRTHFNDRQPEPNIPPEFLEGGCTPF